MKSSSASLHACTIYIIGCFTFCIWPKTTFIAESPLLFASGPEAEGSRKEQVQKTL